MSIRKILKALETGDKLVIEKCLLSEENLLLLEEMGFLIKEENDLYIINE